MSLTEIEVTATDTVPTPPTTAIGVVPDAPAPVSHVYSVTPVADVAGSLHETYFIIHDDAGSVAIVMKENDTELTMPEHGADRAVQAAYSVNDTASDIKQTLEFVADNDSAFSTTISGDDVLITCDEPGERPAGDPGDSGFTVETEVRGFPRLPIQEIPVT